EALRHVLLGDAAIGVDGLVDLTPAAMRVADLEAKLRVLRIELDQLLILGERFVLGALLGQLSRGLEDLPLLNRHPPRRAVLPAAAARCAAPSGTCPAPRDTEV